GKLTIDRIPGSVGAERDIVLHSDHPFRGQTLARKGLRVVAAFGTERAAGLLRRSEWVEALVSPILEQRFEQRLYVVASKILDMLAVALAVAGIVEPGE